MPTQRYMQDWPLLVSNILDHAHTHHGDREIVTRTLEGPIERGDWSGVHLAARKVAQALTALGVKRGDRIATMAWNTQRHMEVWYGIIGAGAICHTLNPRLFAEQLTYIINHAEDRVIFFDSTFAPILAGLAKQFPKVERFIQLSGPKVEVDLPNLMHLDELIGSADGDFAWMKVEETDPCGICYTSGTTGNPKGVVYTHRGNVLHTLIGNTPDSFGMCSVDRVMPVVPMFHANAWGVVYIAPACGAALVLPGMKMDGESIYELLDTEEVSLTAAVPTVWLMLLAYLQQSGKTLENLKKVVIGGSATPRAMIAAFERDYGVEVKHAWGMTEMSPLGTLAGFKAGMEGLDFEGRLDIKVKQGRVPFGVEMKITDDAGVDLPWDGKAFGHLLVRGPCVAAEYYKGEGGDILDADGWFDTGDVATIDPLGFMQITDRSKDVIKSGGEWISSIDLENLAVGHPDIAEAAVIGIVHPKWDERPLLVVVRREGTDIDAATILDFMRDKVARWQVPDAVEFVEEIPHTATGKILKTALREHFADYRLPDVASA